MKLLWNYLLTHKKYLVYSLLFASVNQLFSLLDPQVFRLMIDNYASKFDTLTQNQFLVGIGWLLLAYMGVALVSRIAKNFQEYYVNVIAQRVGTALYADSVKHSFSLPYINFEDQRSGELLQKLQKARDDSQELIIQLINMVFVSLIGIIFVLVYAFVVHWLIGLIYFLLLPILGFSAYFLSKKIRQAQKLIITQQAELAGSTTETLRNVQLVKSLGLDQQEISRLNKVNEDILVLELNKVRIIRTFNFWQGTLFNTMRATLISAMMYLIFTQNISLGQFFTLFIYSFFIFTPLAQFGQVVAKYQETSASMSRLDEILKQKPEQKPANAIVLQSLKEISFDKVGFKYNSGEFETIKSLSAVIKSGENVAFVGPSGSGKTTLIKLIVGLYQPASGELRFNNHLSTQIDFDNFRKRIGLVAQETQLFAGTIRENLLFVRPEATDQECLEVLHQAAADNILSRAEKGLDTKIGEGGLKLSGGERQRLAIARALLRQPDIIIFDEATSSLDSLTEKEITDTIKNIAKLRPDLITVIIAHRLSTVLHADKIFVLEKGSLVESGNHAELLKKSGLYAALWREQMG
ncbi:MAG: ATP-binding cassette, subfamily bacterial [Patescibacteria group bacterium]|nr:ATP-binding cassette, subfamily bacterial [Patescibacteria group bacterium]